MRAILARSDWLTAEQINLRQLVPPANVAQPADDWKRYGCIFSAFIDGKEYFAGYQFDPTGQPLPVIAAILDALGSVADSWKIAAWFHFENGWISGTGEHKHEPVSPMDALDRCEAVVRAAKRARITYIA
jgi:hypothetical protein